MKLFTALLVTLIIIITAFSTKAKAEITNLIVPGFLNEDKYYARQIEQIVFAPVKRVEVFDSPDTKVSNEISYFFYRNGFKSSPVSHVLFEDGEAVTINPNWYTNYFQNNNDKKVLFVIFVYKDLFDPGKFNTAVEKWKNEVLKPVLPFTLIHDAKSIEYKNFTIEPGDEPKIIFSEYPVKLGDMYSFSSLDYKTKQRQPVLVESIKTTDLQKSGSVTKIPISIKNLSNYNLVLSNENPLQFRFKNDSTFFVNNKWLNQRTVAVYKEGVIKAGETKTFDIDIAVPLFPGSSSEELIVQMSDKEISRQNLTVRVEDTGQKILKITTNTLDSLSIFSEPDTKSKEVAKTGRGQVHLFFEEKKGFYKIRAGDKEGWIQSYYTQILNSTNRKL